MYREKSWPEGQFAHYQVRIEAVLPGGAAELDRLVGESIWLPKDNAENIRTVSAAREERLRELLEQRESGAIDEEEHAKRRAVLVHSR